MNYGFDDDDKPDKVDVDPAIPFVMWTVTNLLIPVIVVGVALAFVPTDIGKALVVLGYFGFKLFMWLKNSDSPY